MSSRRGHSGNSLKPSNTLCIIRYNERFILKIFFKNIIPVATPSGLTGRRGDRDPFLALILGEPCL